MITSRRQAMNNHRPPLHLVVAAAASVVFVVVEEPSASVPIVVVLVEPVLVEPKKIKQHEQAKCQMEIQCCTHFQSKLLRNRVC